MAPAIKVALGTWFYKYLLGPDQRPGGLPNEFLSKAPHALLLADEIHCDRHAFQAEKYAANELGFTASKLFMDLESKGILKAVDFEKRIAHLANAFGTSQRRRIVEAQELAMKRLSRPGWRQMELRWPETPFGNFDDACLRQLEQSDGYVSFTWEHLKPKANRLILTREGKDALRILLPPLEVIPDMDRLSELDPEAAEAYAKVRAMEVIKLRDYKLGRLDDDDWREFRTSLAGYDQTVDASFARKAWRRHRLLLTARRKTSGVRKVVADFLSTAEKRSSGEVRRFSEEIEAEVSVQTEALVAEEGRASRRIVKSSIPRVPIELTLSALLNPLAPLLVAVREIDRIISEWRAVERNMDQRYPLARFKGKVQPLLGALT